MAYQFQSEDELISRQQQQKKSTRMKYIVGAVVVLIILGGIAGLVAYFVTKDDSGDPIPVTTTTETTPISIREVEKLDCYPEAGSPWVELTMENCEARGCIYEPSTLPGVPDCYVDVESSGFEMVSAPASLAAERLEFMLRPKKVEGMFGDQFEMVNFTVQYLGDHLIHFSVSTKLSFIHYIIDRIKENFPSRPP